MGLFNFMNFDESAENDVLDIKIGEKPGKEKIDIDASSYNKAIDQLQKTFKEAYETMDMLKNANVIEQPSPVETFREYMENAMFEYFEGPMFEKVSVADKDKILAIVEKIKGKVEEACKKNNIKFREPKRYLSLLISWILPLPLLNSKAIQMIWFTRAFQEIGLVNASPEDVKELSEKLTEALAADLGGYKIIPFEVTPTLGDMIRNKFGWKNQNKVYLLIVDKKIDVSFQTDTEEMAKALTSAK